MSTENQTLTDSYKELVITGPITVERVTEIPGVETGKVVFIFVLLGPTGAGKSTFIESLAPKGSLGISSHQLEGFTQSISLYHIKNMFSSPSIPIYLVDVPGFGDTKLSEMRIVTMIKEWKARTGMQRTKLRPNFVLHTCELYPLPGSQRRMLKTFQSLTGIRSAQNVVIVSTMWDILWGESSTRRAHRNFKQLEDEIWQDYLKGGSKLFKFENTFKSALTILDHASRAMDSNLFHIETTLKERQDLREAMFGANLYQDLQNRIDTLRVQRTNMQVELQDAITRGDTQLSSVVALQLEEAEKLLATFEQELQSFGLPPSLTMTQALPFPDIQQDLRSPSSGSDSPIAVASSSLPTPKKAGLAERLPHYIESDEAPPSATNQPTGLERAEHAGLDTLPKKQGTFTRALNLMILDMVNPLNTIHGIWKLWLENDGWDDGHEVQVGAIYERWNDSV
ncbi:hypothetical protein BJ165DRAFT_1404194 [Panaeolus papilionaceus]|nr:hypothetical protein BJ165DRAFT_1404194 [Panaeolus papilionaceus]